MAPWVRPSPPLLPQRWPAFSSSSPSCLIFLLLPSHPPHCLPHPSEVNSSETFLGSNFHFSLRPLRRPGSVLSGSVQQERQLTPACNSRGDRWGGAGDSWDYDKGRQAVWYASPGRTLCLPYWGDKDDFPCWSLSPIKTKHSNAALRCETAPPPCKVPLPPKEMEPDDLKGGKKIN